MTRTAIYFTDTQGFGGAERVLLTILAGLDRQHWRPVLAYHPGPKIQPLVSQAREMNVELWPVPPMPEGVQGAARVPRFAAQLAARRPAVFHAHLIWPRACKFGLVAAILARVPVTVATLHCFVELSVSRSIRWQQRIVAAGADRYIAVSHDVARSWHAAYQIPASKIQVIHNGISLGAFGRPVNPSLRGELAGSDNRPVVLTLARLDAQKGLEYLVQAAARVPGARFVVAGNGPDQPKLEALVKELGLGDRFVFLGYRRDVPELLAACDLFVLPSLFEGLPLSVLEAMASGKPVVATAIGGTGEAITDGQTGLLVPPADPVALARAIQRILSDPGLGQNLAAAGQVRVRREFSDEKMLASLTRVYNEFLDSPEVPHRMTWGPDAR